jgi:Fe-S cluster biogenesis protein NfuA
LSATDREFLNRVQHIEVLVQALEACSNPAAQEGARQLVRALLDLHGAGLARVLHLASQAGEPGREVVARLGQDGLVSSLLVLHGLHPVPLADRVAGALDGVRPHLHGLGGDVELLQVTGEVIRARLRGDPSAGPALRAAVEEAVLEAAPDVPVVSLEEAWDWPHSGRLPLPLLACKPA